MKETGQFRESCLRQNIYINYLENSGEKRKNHDNFSFQDGLIGYDSVVKTFQAWTEYQWHLVAESYLAW